MPHNPILKHVNLGCFQRMTVEKDTVAVLYKNQRFEREAGAGERISNAQADIVDAGPHTFVWRAELPAADQNDFFSFTITIRYAVAERPAHGRGPGLGHGDAAHRSARSKPCAGRPVFTG